ncbi:MAG: acetyl-CoA carboxylase biotin carboxylase subunit [Bdellovibrionota bacterium]
MFSKVLIANRGEIAMRVIRTCKRLGIKTVAVHSEADANMPFVKNADEAECIGPPPSAQSYLNAVKILEVAKKRGADAVHPGYGFLSENTHFAAECKSAGITFVGPSAHAIENMGDKATARALVQEAGLPTVPGSKGNISGVDEARKVAEEIGYPILFKATAGGGGIGMMPVKSPDDLASCYERASTAALKAFGDGSVYIEKLVENPHHIEVQVLGDKHGNLVHFFERECSVQRRNQKVIEETPAPLYANMEGGQAILEKIYAAAVSSAKAVSYDNAGTIEFIADEKGNFYFIEMNTRLQVEHPITEMTTGVDLVELQLRVAKGEKLPLKQSDIKRQGHAIEFRICAENPAKNFFPSPGPLTEYVLPKEGDGVRVDNGFAAGTQVTPFYDSLVAKLITYGKDRAEAIEKGKKALAEYKVTGTATNIGMHRRLLEDENFKKGKYDTGYLGRFDWKKEGV